MVACVELGVGVVIWSGLCSVTLTLTLLTLTLTLLTLTLTPTLTLTLTLNLTLTLTLSNPSHNLGRGEAMRPPVETGLEIDG